MSPSATSRATHRANVARNRTDRVLFERYISTQEPALREQLVERFLPLARTIALRFRRPNQPMDDLYQVACLGLVKAVDRFDPARGAAFSTFAVPTISGEIRRFFRDTSWTVRPPRDLHDRVLRVDKVVALLTERDGRAPTVTMLAGELDEPEDAVLEARRARRAMDAASLQEHLGGDDGATREDRIGTPDGGYELAEQRVVLEGLMRGISQRERDVLSMRFVNDMTQAEIGQHFGVSQMQISRIVRAAVARMQIIATHEPPTVGSSGAPPVVTP